MYRYQFHDIKQKRSPLLKHEDIIYKLNAKKSLEV